MPRRLKPRPTVMPPGPFSLVRWLEAQTRMLTVEDILEVYPVSPETMYRWIRQQKVPSVPGLDTILIDPQAYAYMLRRQSPVLKAAAQAAARAA